MPKARRKTTQRRPRHSGWASWLRQHRHSLQDSLHKMRAAPAAYLMSVMVIGIALALPAGLQVLIANAQALAGEWDQPTRINLYLDTAVTMDRANELASSLDQREDIAAVQTVSQDEALARFRDHSGLAEAAEALPENPLPITLIVDPAPRLTNAASLEALAGELGGLEGVATAQVEMEWIQRWLALIDTAERGFLVIGLLLALAVVFVTGNTIRLEIENRRDEIVVTKLIGATDAYIRRPFLYSGLLLGLSGGLLALIVILASLVAMDGTVDRLAATYNSAFTLDYPGLQSMLAVLAAGGLLGWAGTWLAVQRHLKTIDPGDP